MPHLIEEYIYKLLAGGRKLIDVRSGQTTPDEAIKKLMT